MRAGSAADGEKSPGLGFPGRVSKVRAPRIRWAPARQFRDTVKNPPLDPDDLPADPDRDDVPEELLEHEGERVFLLTPDGVFDGVLVVIPQFWAHARRLEEGPPPGPDFN